jgi:hypothetical protein
MTPAVLSVSEVASLLQWHEETVYRGLREGRP